MDAHATGDDCATTASAAHETAWHNKASAQQQPLLCLRLYHFAHCHARECTWRERQSAHDTLNHDATPSASQRLLYSSTHRAYMHQLCHHPICPPGKSRLLRTLGPKEAMACSLAQKLVIYGEADAGQGDLRALQVTFARLLRGPVLTSAVRVRIHVTEMHLEQEKRYCIQYLIGSLFLHPSLF